MKIISRPRAAGKTYELLRQVAERGQDAVLVTVDHRQADSLRKLARASSLEIKAEQIIVFTTDTELFHEQLRRVSHFPVLYFDNLDMILSNVLRVPYAYLEVASITGEG